MLADRLHKTIGEIEAMPNTEYLSWIAYLLLEQERMEQEKSRTR